MARFLIVAHQTAASNELVERAKARMATDPSAEFVLLVPATPTYHLLTWEEGEARLGAARRGAAAAAKLREAGVRLAGVRVGVASPMEAVGDELLLHPGYEGIVLSTFPPGISRWLKGDLPSRLQLRYRLPIDHVVAAPATAHSTQAGQ